MKVRYEDADLERLEGDPRFDRGYPPGVVKAFRGRMQMIRNAPDERDFYALKSLRFEKLKGTKNDERSMRLNDQFRLIVRIEPGSEKTLVIVALTDYH